MQQLGDESRSHRMLVVRDRMHFVPGRPIIAIPFEQAVRRIVSFLIAIERFESSLYDCRFVFVSCYHSIASVLSRARRKHVPIAQAMRRLLVFSPGCAYSRNGMLECESRYLGG